MQDARRRPRPFPSIPLTASVLTHLALLVAILVTATHPRPEEPLLSIELVSLPAEPAQPSPVPELVSPAPTPLSEASAPAPAQAVVPAPMLVAAEEATPALAAAPPDPALSTAAALVGRIRVADKPVHRRSEPHRPAAMLAARTAPEPERQNAIVSTAAAAPSPPPSAGPADPSWQRALAAWLAAHKHYPEEARENGQEGAVGVAFTVLRDGRVQGVRIARSSGLPVLDRSVQAMLANERVPPFPAIMTVAQTEVRVMIRFELSQ